MELEQDFREFIELLNAHKVDYLVVGGYAVTVHGYPRYTGDIDFWVRPVKENAEKMEKVIIAFGFGSLDISKEDFLREDYVIQLGYPPNRLDIMTSVSGLEFDKCWEKREIVESQGLKINFIGLQDLIVNKQKTGRDKDKLDLKNLPSKKK